jgi:alpha-1,3-mannosyltransferase
MRVLEVARQFYPKVGGIESCVLNLSQGLRARGHTVEVVTLDRDLVSGERLDSPSAIASIRIHRVPYVGSRRYPIAPSWIRLADSFDILHVHAIDFFVDSAALGKRLGLHRKPIVLTTHGGIFHTSAWRPLKNFYWRNVLSHTLGKVSTVVAVSESDAALFGPIVAPEKLVTIHNGIDPAFAAAALTVRDEVAAPRDWVAGIRSPQSFGSPSRVRRRLVSVGRVTRAKAIDKIVDLVARIAPEFPDVELIIAGPDENGASDDLRRHSAALGLARRVHVIGPLPLNELARLVASAHLYISAAPHEGFGITTVEALSAGVPVLVRRTGVHEDVVRSGLNGWFWSGEADPASVAILRDALLLPDAALARMRDSARESAAPFDWNLAIDKYECVLESANRESVG